MVWGFTLYTYFTFVEEDKKGLGDSHCVRTRVYPLRKGAQLGRQAGLNSSPAGTDAFSLYKSNSFPLSHLLAECVHTEVVSF